MGTMLRGSTWSEQPKNRTIGWKTSNPKSHRPKSNDLSQLWTFKLSRKLSAINDYNHQPTTCKRNSTKCLSSNLTSYAARSMKKNMLRITKNSSSVSKINNINKDFNKLLRKCNRINTRPIKSISNGIRKSLISNVTSEVHYRLMGICLLLRSILIRRTFLTTKLMGRRIMLWCLV